jgi:hypothetical protein
VKTSNVHERDDRTEHESVPVERGVKYGCNMWLHLHPFRSIDERQEHCDNSEYAANWY